MAENGATSERNAQPQGGFRWWGVARLLVRRALQLGQEATPEEGPGLGAMTNSHGHKLQTKVWPAAGSSPPRALVIFCHGYGTAATHLPAWQRVANLLTDNGFACAGIDYAGHGFSEGRRSRVESIESLVDDVLQFVDQLVPQFPACPVFIRGQSMGGLVAVVAALRSPNRFAGLALGAPAYELRWLPHAFAPRAITEGGWAARAKISSLTTPLAVFQGVSDGTVAAEGARHLVTDSSAAARALYLYSMGHNMSIEPDVCAWLESRLDQPSGGGALLHVRRPQRGVQWTQPPPGSEDANEGTVLETIMEPTRQAAVLDELLRETTGRPLMAEQARAEMQMGLRGGI